MIFYIESENYILYQFEDIKADLIELQKREFKKTENILALLIKLNDVIQSKKETKNVQLIIKMLEDIKSLSDNLKSNKTDLENLKTILSNIFSENEDILLNDDIRNKINEYNKLAKECKNKLFITSEQYENFIIDYIKDIALLNNSIENQVSNTPLNVAKKNTNELKDNRTLLISETKKAVFLPYFACDLEKELNKNPKYNSIQEIIDSEYIIPISRYDNSIISRFKEAYNLMKNKENSSIIDSLDLALELAFNSLLNPAIISACRNLDELDIYLDCLSSNELDKFDIFDIKYEFLPRKSNSKKSETF